MLIFGVFSSKPENLSLSRTAVESRGLSIWRYNDLTNAKMRDPFFSHAVYLCYYCIPSFSQFVISLLVNPSFPSCKQNLQKSKLKIQGIKNLSRFSGPSAAFLLLRIISFGSIQIYVSEIIGIILAFCGVDVYEQKFPYTV